MARKRRQRVRTSHPGVKIKTRVRPGWATLHLARWKDPASGRWRELSLTPLGLTAAEARHAWAVAKAADLAMERAALAAGLVPIRNEPRTVAEAVEEYLGRCRGRLRPRTVEIYTLHLSDFVRYMEETGLSSLDRLTSPQVSRYREEIAARRRLLAVKGGRRGMRRQGRGARSPATVNRVMSSIKAFLMDARRLGLTPRLDRDGITDGLKRLREPRPRPAILRAAELEAILAAALRHDAETWAMTRAEHDGLKLAGTTPRYPPIAPLVLAALGSGCRLGELLTLRWEHVHLNSPDRGELVVTATASKTATERAVSLEESPSLVQLLAALKLKSEGAPHVFGGKAPLPRTTPEAGRRRLAREYGAPGFSFQRLRQTCAAYLACAPGIYGGGAPYREAMRLGHGVAVAERNYIGMVKDIPKAAATLEAAMGIEDLAERVVAHAGGAVPTGADAAKG